MEMVQLYLIRFGIQILIEEETWSGRRGILVLVSQYNK